MWAMGGFLLRRLAFGLLAMFVALSGSFFFFASKFFPLRDQPLLHVYWVWVRGLATGRSFSHGIVYPHLFSLVGGAFGRTMLLLALTLVVVLVVSIPLGCLAAATRGSVLDFTLRSASYVAWAVPAYLVAIVLQDGFGRIPLGWGLGWFPAVGWAGECPNGQGVDVHSFQCPGPGTGLTHVGLVLYHLTLPAIALALGFIGVNARYLRSSVLDALDAPHITVARAKGLGERSVLLRHGLRNALVTFVPALVSDLGVVFGAALAIDYIFKLGGIGTLFISLLQYNVDGIVSVDTYAVQLALLLGAAVMLATSLLGEIALTLLDPRTRTD
jgi:ABC-type dipeptide/oligopeptide/nickel transport system permease component